MSRCRSISYLYRIHERNTGMTAPELRWECKSWQELSNEDQYKIIQLRIAVFIIEQKCFYQELDGKDKASLHVLGRKQEGDLLAYARILPPGAAFTEPAIGRILVAAYARGCGLGAELIRKSIDYCINIFDLPALCISAQLQLRKYYENLGFIAEGNPYDEDGIDHIKMRYSRLLH